MSPPRTRRRLLGAGLGLAAFTALEGLACGNPLEPRCPASECPDAAVVDAPRDAPIDAGVDAEIDAAIDAPIDAMLAPGI
ncbi:MAG: hypothetical protein IPQ07_27490 [Myxococcales bacterium]|nr:hypothetical protein [Myxococcales bacterium]